MLTRILVPLDGSNLGERALPYATVLARAAHASLILLHARPPQETGAGLAFDPEAVADRLRETGLEVETRLVDIRRDEVGEAVGRAICEAGREQRADLIAMSTHGRGGLERWVYGSAADIVVRNAPAPVLLISLTCEHRWLEDRTLRIMVPLDGSELSEAALGPAGELAGVLGAGLLLARVVEAGHAFQVTGLPSRAVNPEVERAEARHYLEGVKGRLPAGPTVETWTEIGQPTSAIADLAREREIDLVAMATHGRGGLARVALGSTATRILQRAGVPLLLVRPAALR